MLGDETECSSEPQSLIAEYFIDCQPAGDAAARRRHGPAAGHARPSRTTSSLNTLRLPYKQRLQLLINEFGTALAGNPENLNEAIRLGAPALQDLHKALKMLADQNTVIAQLNVDSDEIIGKLAARSDGRRRVRRRRRATPRRPRPQRRDDLSTDFDLLDDALRELGPTMAELEDVARETTPLLADLRGRRAAA